jgi:hypothetical protein
MDISRPAPAKLGRLVPVALLLLLCAIAAGGWQSWSQRARLQALLLAAAPCQARVLAQLRQNPDHRPGAGAWGCEVPADQALATHPDVAAIGTDAAGRIGIRIDLQRLLVVGATPASAIIILEPVAAQGRTPGSRVWRWQCGSADTAVLRLLPAHCNTWWESTPLLQTDATRPL